MLASFTTYLPDGIAPAAAVLLVLLAGFTSFISAAAGSGGGTLLIAVMALVMPVQAIIPVHGLVQVGSNTSRSLMMWRHIHWPTLLYFVPGALLGTIAAAYFLVVLPAAVLQLSIAFFVLYLCWGPKLPSTVLNNTGTLVAAGLTTFIGYFVGASGPLVAVFIKQKFAGDRATTVGTFATTMVVQHGPKALVFGITGFVFKEWWLLVLLMIAAGAVGTKLGLLRLFKLSEQRFSLYFNMVLTLIAVRLLWQALPAFFLF